jgi:DNA polymerase (family 10)
VRGEDEAALYASLALPLIPPELREGRGEVEAAALGETFADLVTFEDLRGGVHCHTLYSDGRDTVAGMATAAERLGLEYLTITDHSPAAAYAGGLTSERIHEQWDEIAAVRRTTRVDLLRGAECDILPDGTVDHSDDDRGALDCVIASVHRRHGLDAAAMTERLVRAMRAPGFKIWGHPLGRLLLRREPIACDLERVFDAVASSAAAIEINGSPWRLDLPPDLIPAARARGAKFVVSADAHSVDELEYLRYGVAMARRGGLRRADVLNTLPAAEFRRAVHPTRSRA